MKIMSHSDDARLADPLRMLSAFSLGSGSTVAAVAMSVATTKIVATFMGAEGVALSGLFRSLSGTLIAVIGVGSATIIMQRMSSAHTKEESDRVISAGIGLFAVQAALAACAALVAAGPISRWLFGAAAGAGAATEVRIVLVMGAVNLALQTAIALLKGQPDVRLVAAVNLATAAVSLLLAYPLIDRLGRFGLAVNVGSGGLAGLLIASVLILRAYRPSVSYATLASSWRFWRAAVGDSAWLVLQSVGMLSGTLLIQSIIGRHYGLASLGYYNAAMLILDSLVLVAMGSMRAYALPALGRIQDGSLRLSFFSRSLTLLAGINLSASLLLIAAAGLALRVLFSAELSAGAEFLAVSSLSLVGLSFAWSYNTVLLKNGDIRLLTLLDLASMALLVAAVWLAARWNLPLLYCAWAHAGVQAALGAAYMSAAALRYGSEWARFRDAAFGLAGLAATTCAYFLARRMAAFA